MQTSNVTRVGMGILVVREGKFLLGKRIGPHMFGYFAAPGGHMEYGESFEACARRELLEETGLEAASIELLMIGNYLFGNKHYVDIDVVVETLTGDAKVMEPEKCAGWDWYAPDALPVPLFIVTQRMIQTYLNDERPVCRDLDEVTRD